MIELEDIDADDRVMIEPKSAPNWVWIVGIGVGVALLVLGIVVFARWGLLYASAFFAGSLIVLISSVLYGDRSVLHYGNPPRPGYHQGQLVRYREHPVALSLIDSCPHCGQLLSPIATSCPGCGREVRKSP